MKPPGAIVNGTIAGAAGMLAMDLGWYRRYRRRGGDQPFADGELRTSLALAVPRGLQCLRRLTAGVSTS